MEIVSPLSRPIPSYWEPFVAQRLLVGETVQGWFEVDLNAQLRYERQLIVVTEKRLLEFSGSSPSENGAAPRREWQVTNGLKLSSKERGTLGTLDLTDQQARLAHWKYTLDQADPATEFTEAFGTVQRILNGEVRPAQTELRRCPNCHALIPAEASDCPECAAEPEPERPKLASLFRLWRFAKPRLGMFILGAVLTVSSTAFLLTPPLFFRPLIDDVLVPAQQGQGINWTQVYWCLGGMIICPFIYWGLAWVKRYVLAWVSERISADIRSQTYAQLHRLSLEYFGSKRTGDLISRVGSDSDRICNFLSLWVLDFFSDLLMIVMTAGILFYMNPLLALVSLLPLPAVGFLIHHLRGRMRHNYRQGSRAWAEILSALTDTIPGARVVKAFAQESREIERFDRANEHYFTVANWQNKLWAFFQPTVELMHEIGMVVIWVVGAILIFQLSITVGTLQAFVYYIQRFYAKLEAVSGMVSATTRAANSTGRIFDILDRQSTVPEPLRPVHPGRLQGALEIRNVGFKYGPRTVLEDVNLSIRPGEMIGLVGHSGSGKSTLVNMICRFYDVGEGSIQADGHDLRSFPVEEYRRNLGLVLQEPYLFYGTIAENIAYGKPAASREQIIMAAKAAGAHEFILLQPEGYDSVVGERGQTLSGGERQRISIARALLIDPAILILDEATSSVDTETERDIQQALDVLIQGRTTIAIAHRLSTLRKADRLIVLERGKIVQVGTHNDLIQQDGIYARLCNAQREMNEVTVP